MRCQRLRLRSFTALALCATVHFVASNAHSALVQWPVDEGGNGHWYGLTSHVGNWDGAEAEAIASGGHLASITSFEENAFISALATAPSSGATFATWLGLRRIDASQPWTWSDRSATTYFNWTAGEPNNATGNEFFGWMYTPSIGGVWNDHNQTRHALRGMIEVVPAPGAMALLGLVGLARRSRGWRSAR